MAGASLDATLARWANEVVNPLAFVLVAMLADIVAMNCLFVRAGVWLGGGYRQQIGMGGGINIDHTCELMVNSHQFHASFFSFFGGSFFPEFNP